MYKLRNYQKEAVEKSLNFLLNPKIKYNGLIVLPTGSGKSLVIANIARGLDDNLLIFQPSKEILEQNYKKLVSYGKIASIYSASFNSKQISKITFATIGSVKSNPELFNGFKYIIVDECHFVNAKKGMYKEFFKIIDCKILGLTATPYRLVTDGYGGSILKFLTRTRPRVFKDVIYHSQVGDLFKNGYLSPLKYYQVKGFDSKHLKINTTGADYTDQSIKTYYQKTNYSNRIIKVVDRCLEIGRKNILIFTRFIEEAQEVKDCIGDICEIVTSKTNKRDRERIINNFRNGKIKIISNVKVLSIGFDFPELETIIDTSPTMSLALYYQKLGRGIRIHPEKGHCMIIDMCENFKRFGKIEDLHLMYNKPGLWYIRNSERQLTNVYYG